MNVFLDATKVTHFEVMHNVAFPNILPSILSCRISTISRAMFDGKSIIDSSAAMLSETNKHNLIHEIT